VHLAEGSGEPESPPATPAPAPAKPAQRRPVDPKAEHRAKYGSLPDPEPLKSKTQWELELSYDHGAVSLSSATRREFETPVATARRMGRFAVELWIGHELIDRVRFDFPLVMNAPPREGPRDLSEQVRFDSNTTSSQTVLVPDSPRATRVVVVDRASGQETPLTWPPDRPQGPASPAGHDHAP